MGVKTDGKSHLPLKETIIRNLYNPIKLINLVYGAAEWGRSWQSQIGSLGVRSILVFSFEKRASFLSKYPHDR